MHKVPKLLFAIIGIGISGLHFFCNHPSTPDPINQNDNLLTGFPIAAASVDHDTVWPGAKVSLSASGSKHSDANGKITEYAWKLNNSVDSWITSVSPDTTIDVNATMKIVLRVTDQKKQTAFDTVSIITLWNMYVDSSAHGANTGKCWTDAFNDLQKALSAAVNGIKIQVAKGTYYPASLESKDNDRSFFLKNGVKMYGGYPSGGGTRDTSHKSILSGGEWSNDFDRVVVSSSMELYSSTLLDGFTIEGGHGKKPGTGISLPRSSSLTIANCCIINNNCDTYGGGVYLADGSPDFANCKFISNSASEGSGVYCNSGKPVFTDCIFSGNYGDGGSGVNVKDGSVSFSRCLFVNNISYGYGGGLYINNGKVVVSKCSFIDNFSDYSGAGVCFKNGELLIDSSSFKDNGSDRGKGGAIMMYDGAFTLLNSSFTNNIAVQAGGAIRIDSDNGLIANCTFSANKNNSAAGALALLGENTKVLNCTFFKNMAEDSGGACMTFAGLTTTFVHCTFFSNSSPKGQSLFHSGTETDSGKLSLINCILWSDDNLEDSVQIRSASPAFPLIKNCVIRNNYSGPGTLDSIFVSDPQLSPPGDNGGPVQTCTIGITGSAHNTGTSNIPIAIDISKDCRNLPRADKPDIGAFEIQENTGILSIRK